MAKVTEGPVAVSLNSTHCSDLSQQIRKKALG